MPELDPDQRVVVTGMGVVSPLGFDVDSTWQAVVNGESGIVSIRDSVLKNYQKIGVHVGAPVNDFDLLEQPYLSERMNKKDLRSIHRSTQFALWAGTQALQQAGLLDPEGSQGKMVDKEQVDPTRFSIRIGSGIGGANELGESRLKLEDGQHLPPSSLLRALPGRVATVPSMVFGAQGSTEMIVAECATGNANIISGMQLLKSGDADVVLAGGVEAQLTTPEALGLFERTGALDLSEDPDQASRPFHREANGFVIGEGAGILVLETLEHALGRGALVLAELRGYGDGSDAYDPVMMDVDSVGRVIKQARAKAAIQPDEVGYINAHATGTAGDGNELLAIDQAFASEEIAGISSTKGATGHLLGGASAVESVISIMALREGVIPPTIKLDKPVDETEGWYMPTEAQRAALDYVVNNSFGFGGVNKVVVYGSV